MKEIKMVDLHGQYLRIKSEIDAAIQLVLESAAFIKGTEVSEFEDALARHCHAAHVISCGNGTDALQIAMMALDLQRGDEVILPDFTYAAPAEVIALLGLTPVFIDVDKQTFNIDIDQLEKKITKKTKAIVPVHLFGQCAHMEPLLDIAQRHDIRVIEDAAQALGGEYTFSDGTKKRAGTMGVIGCTSFFPSKNLGCYGDGGALLTHDLDLAEKIRMIANHGQRKKYEHEIVGVNSRLDTLQAAVLRVKLNHLDDFSKRRNEAVSFYDRMLASIPGLAIPWRSPFSTHVFHQYTIQVAGPVRDQLKQHLSKNRIPSMIYYPIPLHRQKAYHRAGVDDGALSVSESLSKTVLSLPLHTEMTSGQLEFICSTLQDFFATKAQKH